MVVQSPDPQRDPNSIHDLFAETFSDFWTWRDNATNGYFVGAPYDWEASRVGMVDGEVASHFGVWDFAMRIESAVVRVAGIGAVATKRSLRTRGMMKSTATDAVAGLSGLGYDLSLLFGIQKYYLQFGYVSTFDQGTFSVSARDLSPTEPAVKYESFSGDVTALAGQYNDENSSVTGTYVRPTYTSNRRLNKFAIWTFDGGYLVCGRDGQTLQVSDCAGPPEKILDVCRQRANSELTPQIDFVFLPPRSRLGEYLQARTHTYQARYHEDGGPMIKITNLESCFTKIAPVLTKRMREAGMKDYTGTVRIHGDGESVALSMARGEITSVEPIEHRASSGDGTDPGHDPRVPGQSEILAGPGLARLVIGDTYPLRICRENSITLTGDASFLVPILFPDQEPSTILWDRF